MSEKEIEQIILRKFGLTDKELRDFLKKLGDFYLGLTQKEQKAFLASVPVSEKESVKAFSDKITANELEQFIKSREPKGLRGAPLMIFECVGGYGGHRPKKQRRKPVDADKKGL
jgi:hypothetical protein